MRPPIMSTLTIREAILAIALASTSGAAILAHTFAALPMAFTVPFIVIPSVFLLLGAMLAGRGRIAQLHLLAALLTVGTAAGTVATVAYDLIRLVLRWALGFSFNPFGAIPIFGQLMTGLSPAHPIALAAGIGYHFWNGISFGMMFALVKPRGGALPGVVWGLGLAALMLVTYTYLLHINPEDPGFLTADFVGHGVWGVVLGVAVRAWGPYARA